ncbi:MAG: anaerobic ribonucleoside-triphosphate reductase activating protein [Sulfuricellaceae bacterium]|nr:anaerobic ribonucleoside-triphosphate reductase activating protein [Sulfuricellaceae bacterium]
MQIAGLTPLTTTDYPGKLAAVVFCQGCPWQCAYCHNPGLIPRQAEGHIAWEEIISFLQRRQGLLDGVVFSGGEPTLQSGLGAACQQVRALGFKTGLHTAGTYPERLKEWLPLFDWVGMDIKARFGDYEKISGVPGSGERASLSLQAVLESGVDYEIRTTVHPGQITENGIILLGQELAALGVQHYVPQAFRAQGCVSSDLLQLDVKPLSWGTIQAALQPLFQSFSIRGN